ncbi:MAG: protein-export chaperone SecB [Lachnospiraceae bacterium]|nr:protein-export chaperone SecB [Lachnospiraceae bacterium]
MNDELTNEQINDLLRINGAAVLYSYLRPIVSNLTNNSALPVLNLPFIDFTESK